MLTIVLGLALRLWLAHLPRLVAMTLLLWSPIEIVAALVPVDRAWLVRGALAGLLEPWWTAAVVVLAHDRRRRSLFATLDLARRRYARLIGVRVVLGVRIAAGLIGGVIPGVVLATHYALSEPLAILEGHGPSDCRERSSQLVHDRFWSTLLLGLGLFFAQELLELLRDKLGSLVESLPWTTLVGCAIALLSAFAPLCWFAMYRESRASKQG